MNPRVSRSSALASKATGFPIAKIAAKLAVGYTLDEIPNDITEETPASFEPTLDYVVVKVPRFAFEKFPAADATLTTTMKSVGEAMAIGRNFTEALQKALRSLEKQGLGSSTWAGPAPTTRTTAAGRGRASRPTAGSHRASRRSAPAPPSRRCYEATKIDPWFLDQIAADPRDRARAARTPTALDRELLRRAKRHGFSDAQIADIRGLARDGGPRAAARARRAAGLQDRRHLRRRVRRARRRTTTRPTTRRPRSRRATQAGGDHPGLRAQPDRAGHRVRLLLRARRRSRCATPATRPSWSTATRRPSPPTTTPPTGCTSSR